MGLLDRLGRFIDDVLLLPEEVRDTLGVAEQALEAELFEEAEALYAEVLAERPTLARASVGLAHARVRRGDAAGARRAVDEARASSPDNGALALFAARLAVGEGEHRRASEAARDAARLYAREGGAPLAEAFALWAEAERGQGRFDRAARELQKAVAVEPDDSALRVRLIEALAEAGQEASARASAQGLDREALGGAEALRVGRALRQSGAMELSAAFLEAAVAARHAPALLELSRVLMASGRLDEAESRARQAVARGGGAEALGVLGEILSSQHRGAEAAEVFAEGARVSGALPLWRAAVRVAKRQDAAALEAYVDALEARAPGDPVARAGRAQARLSAGALDEAAALLDAADEEPRAILALAELSLRRGAPADALAALERFVARVSEEPGAAGDLADAAELRRDALRASWRGPSGEVDLAAAIDAVARFGSERGMGEVERAALALRDELDRPLVLAVLGEFNAGKSTLINAFIGAEVAPMGVVPTTATLNLLRSGAERRVRVVRRDGSTREGSYEDLRALLAEAGGHDLDASDAVDRVEITLPGELLERVWILDAPGTNALDASHERLAREAARRADAVLWVYDAGQAGKRSEGEMQRAIASRGRLIVPVLNKADRLDEASRQRVLRALAEAQPELGAPLFLSARRALAGRVAGDAAEVEASGFAALLAQLDREVFSQSRAVKQKACGGRLLSILDEALASEASTVERFDRELAQLQAAGGRLIGLGERLEALVEEKLRWLEVARQAAFVEAAAEVLGFVRPRRGQFSRHGAEPADRRFLQDMLERRLRAAIRECEASLVEGAFRLVVAAVDCEAPSEAPRFDIGDPRWLLARGLAAPLAEHWGYQQGLFAAGSLERFFDDFLPYASLEREPIAGALARATVDPHGQLRPSLRAATATLVTELEAARSRAADAKVAQRRRLTEQVYGPLRALRQVLAELTRITRGSTESRSL